MFVVYFIINDMNDYQWVSTLDSAITVCDTHGVILYMNEMSHNTFSKNGDSLIGRNLREFHNERSWAIIQALLRNRTSNEYTIKKGDVHKLIKQSCWYCTDGSLGGLVELSVVIPNDLPHYVR